MQNTTEIFTGRVADVTTIPTRTGVSMITLLIGNRRCKAFGEVADVCATLDGANAEITATAGQYLGKPEYAVVSVKATVEGREVSAKDNRLRPEVNERSELEQIMQRTKIGLPYDDASLRKIAGASDAELQHAAKSTLRSCREAAKEMLARRAAIADDIRRNPDQDVPF